MSSSQSAIKPETRSLATRVTAFAKELAHEFASEIDQNPTAFKATVVRLLRRTLPRRVGRRPLAEVTRAIELRAQGRTWPEVYSTVISNHESLDTFTRQSLERQLRERVRGRRVKQRKARRPEKTRTEKGEPENRSDVVPS